ncbi:MAG: hypothetical protein QOG59_1174 [Solirubrobacteraceae bacterium]|jgi:hypothetical protein|nr:hypothetical protein [Solirubrobacteraceae bacterium]
MRSVSTRFTGLLLVALGLWGGLVPFVGHYFHFALGPDKSWDWTTNRLYLDVLPAAATILGGLNLMSAGPRRSARLGALLGLAGGIWFAIGPEISQLWTAHGAQGAGHGSAHVQMLEMLTYHTGLGVLVTALAAYALPRFPVAEAAVAPAGGRFAAAGAGAGAGAVAGSHDDRWYHEPGALEDPRQRAGDEGELEPQTGATRQHSTAGPRDGVAGDEARPSDRLAADEAGREPASLDQAGRGEPIVAGAAARDRGAADGARETAGGAREVQSADEPTGVRSASPDAGTPAAQDGAAAGNGAEPGAVPAGAGAPGDPGATSATTAYPASEPVARRRRGGLLSGLLRR